MLQAAAQEAVTLDDPLLAVKVEVTDARPRLARDRHGDARAGQAALVLGHRIAFDLEDLGVDEDDGIALLLLAVDDDEALENAELGRRGEDAAARFLYRRGYDIVERNWKCAAGEADIIARDGDAVVFVEVKTRSSVEKGLPSDAVDKRKRERYEKIAALFLAAVDVPVRFDVVSLLVIGADRALVRHHINAFAAG